MMVQTHPTESKEPTDHISPDANSSTESVREIVAKDHRDCSLDQLNNHDHKQLGNEGDILFCRRTTNATEMNSNGEKFPRLPQTSIPPVLVPSERIPAPQNDPLALLSSICERDGEDLRMPAQLKDLSCTEEIPTDKDCVFRDVTLKAELRDDLRQLFAQRCRSAQLKMCANSAETPKKSTTLSCSVHPGSSELPLQKKQSPLCCNRVVPKNEVQGPESYKSPYILFFMAKKNELRNKLGPNADFTEHAKTVAKMWSALPPDGQERQYWENQARLTDTSSFRKELDCGEESGFEKCLQTTTTVTRNDCEAQQRHVSGFYHFCQETRSTVEAQNKNLNPAEITRLLENMWKSADTFTRTRHRDWEIKERAKNGMASRKVNRLTDNVPSDTDDIHLFCDEEEMTEIETIGTIPSNTKRRIVRYGDRQQSPKRTRCVATPTKGRAKGVDVSSGSDLLDLLSSVCERERTGSCASSPSRVDDAIFVCTEELQTQDVDENGFAGCSKRDVFCLQERAVQPKYLRPRPNACTESNPISPLGRDSIRKAFLEPIFATQSKPVSPDNKRNAKREKEGEISARTLLNNKIEAAKKLSIGCKEATATSVPSSVTALRKRSKSAYIFFFAAKKDEVREKLGPNANFTEHAKTVAEMWRALPKDSRERKHFEEQARLDKIRFNAEKDFHKGPCIDDVALKAPKRPMSAFLHYSKEMRKSVQDQNPNMNHCDISKLLGEMWKNVDDATKKRHCDWEMEQRARYNNTLAEWKEYCQKRQDVGLSDLEIKEGSISLHVDSDTNIEQTKDSLDDAGEPDLMCGETDVSFGSLVGADVLPAATHC